MTNFFNIIESDVTYTEALEKISANVLYNELKSAQAVLEQKEADKFNDGKGEKSESGGSERHQDCPREPGKVLVYDE